MNACKLTAADMTALEDASWRGGKAAWVAEIERIVTDRCALAWDEGATAAWYDCQIGTDDSRDACEMRVDNPYEESA